MSGGTAPPGDRLQRAAVRLSGLGVAGALLALGPRIGLSAALNVRPAAHARAVALGFLGVFISGFLLRILPRSRGVRLRGAPLAGLGLLTWAGTAVVDGLGWAPDRVLAGLWGVGGLLLGGALADLWREQARPSAWFDGWIVAGLLGSGASLCALCWGLWTGSPVATRAPGAFLLSGAAPVTLGLAARMLPSLSGLRSPGRDRFAALGRVAPLLALAIGGASLVGRDRLAGMLLLVLILGSARGLGWLRTRDDGGPSQRQARQAAAPRLLRAVARFAFLSAGLGALCLLWPSGRVAGLHALGLGFLASMALGIGSRVIPAFVRGEPRWPRLRGLSPSCLAGALLLRLLALSHPSLLPASAALFALAWGLFLLQVQPSLRSPARSPPPDRPCAPNA